MGIKRMSNDADIWGHCIPYMENKSNPAHILCSDPLFWHACFLFIQGGHLSW